MIIVTVKLAVTMFLNHHVMTITNVPKITVMKQPVLVSLNLLAAMIMINVLTMNATQNLVAPTGLMAVMMTTHVLVILAILLSVVYLKIFLANVKLTTNVTKIVAALLSDVLMI
jgi:hypothetical protein